MTKTLESIKTALNSDIKEYNRVFGEIMSSDVRLVDRIARYIVKHKGKGLRPLLVLLCSRLCGEPTKNTYIIASVVEMLHTASLIHDDVVDGAHVRRGLPSINAIWKNKISILMGDYLLSKCLIAATDTGSLEVMRVMANTAKRLSKGELFQIEKSRKLDITEQEYYQLVSDKTAALISACCELGAISACNEPAKRDYLKQFGENIGIAFQITDDLLDYEGKQTVLGKPVGSDLKEKKITLPLILSFKTAPGYKKKEIIKLLKRGADKRDVNKIVDFCRDYNGINLAEESMLKWANRAIDCLEKLQSQQFREQAFQFVDYVVKRTK